MEDNHKLGLYISYYLARFDNIAYRNLGYGNQIATHVKIGELLHINPYTVKNWRDEFDRFYKHRAGWHQRKPRPAIIEVKELLDKFHEKKILQVVKSILACDYQDKILNDSIRKSHLISVNNNNKKEEIFLNTPAKRNNELAIIIAFYLSKFDKLGLQNLGYKNDSEAFEDIAVTLGIKKNYIKFRRDEFDPIHPWRKGWQRPMDGRIIRAIEALQDLDEADLREIVLNILCDETYRSGDDARQMTMLFTESKKVKVSIGKFILRAPTGRQAEEFFIHHFIENKFPVAGDLIDCRDFGIGYDFRIESAKGNFFVEVKGLTDYSGGILFTNKEWSVAKSEQDKYFLCVISNLAEKPEIIFIQNPATQLNPKKNIYTSIQISWSVTQNQLSKLNDRLLKI